MINKKFFTNNINKFYKNFKIKNYKLKKFLIKSLIKLKIEIFKKIKFIKNKRIKNFFKIYNDYINKIIKIFSNYFNHISKILKIIFLKFPNLTHYIVLKKNKIIKKKNYKIKNKFENNKNFNFNIKLSNEIVGAGFNFIIPPLSNIYENLKKYLINIHLIEHNYKNIVIPEIISFKSLILSGQIPKFIKKLFIIRIKNKIKYLIPTAEVNLVNFMINKNIKSKFIPVKLISITKCYRNENLFYGLKNKNIIRRKQFDKVELLNFININHSNQYLIEMLKNIEKLLRNLKINYRILKLSKFNLNYNSLKTYDIEVWLPSINNYCEISSCSDTGSYQSFKLNIKYSFKNLKNNLRILNGSGTAIGRLFLSLLENYYYFNKIIIPKFLYLL